MSDFCMILRIETLCDVYTVITMLKIEKQKLIDKIYELLKLATINLLYVHVMVFEDFTQQNRFNISEITLCFIL